MRSGCIHAIFKRGENKQFATNEHDLCKCGASINITLVKYQF